MDLVLQESFSSKASTTLSSSRAAHQDLSEDIKVVHLQYCKGYHCLFYYLIRFGTCVQKDNLSVFHMGKITFWNFSRKKRLIFCDNNNNNNRHHHDNNNNHNNK